MPHPRAEVFWQVTHHRDQRWNNVLIIYNSPFLALRVLEVRGGIPGQGEEGEGAGAGVALDSLYL